MVGRVIKNISDRYEVLYDNKVLVCVCRGKLKVEKQKCKVGDFVEVKCESNGHVIEKILPRKNDFVRPPLCNLDMLVIVISEIPKPDFLLVDKLIVICKIYGITPIICINKIDIINKKFIDDTIKDYSLSNVKICLTSTKTKQGLENLKDIIKNNVVALAGQSATGKSSIINALSNQQIAKTDGLTKIGRGKNTTRHTQIHLIGNDIMLADTAGFSLLNLLLIKKEELKNYYDEFSSTDKCKYKSCVHIYEKIEDCFIKRQQIVGNISINRYNRYIELFNEIKKYWESRYE